jgi:hypothetical protein
MYTLIVLIIGIFIGWNLPQPPWAKSLQNKATAGLRSLLKK